jgi:hypothetical protein
VQHPSRKCCRRCRHWGWRLSKAMGLVCDSCASRMHSARRMQIPAGVYTPVCIGVSQSIGGLASVRSWRCLREDLY